MKGYLEHIWGNHSLAKILRKNGKTNFKTMKNLQKNDNVWTWISDSRPENPAPGVIFCVDFEFEVKICGFRRPEAKN